MKTFISQTLPIIDPIHSAQVVDSKKRVTVHNVGLWHPTVQAYIIAGDASSLRTLVQKRSSEVDIGKGLFDQSLATHIQSGETPEQALERGLSEELGITLSRTKFMRVLSQKKMYVTKTYQEDLALFNRELLHLYIVVLPNSVEVNICSKLDSFFWTDWQNYVQMTLQEPQSFTKTSRYYLIHQPLRAEIERELYSMLTIQQPQTDTVAVEEKLHYISLFLEHEGTDAEILLKQQEMSSAEFDRMLMYNKTALADWLMKKISLQ